MVELHWTTFASNSKQIWELHDQVNAFEITLFQILQINLSEVRQNQINPIPVFAGTIFAQLVLTIAAFSKLFICSQRHNQGDFSIPNMSYRQLGSCLFQLIVTRFFSIEHRKQISHRARGNRRVRWSSDQIFQHSFSIRPIRICLRLFVASISPLDSLNCLPRFLLNRRIQLKYQVP